MGNLKFDKENTALLVIDPYDELYEAPRRWTARAHHKLIYYNKLDKRRCFAAWEQPNFHCGIPCGFQVASLCDIRQSWTRKRQIFSRSQQVEF